jgi:hypothetical protein
MEPTQWNIVIALSGWVYVGRPSREGELLVIRDCYNIRRWGTTSGLGELALEGPKEGTQVDYYGTVKVHVLGLAGGLIECDDAKWNPWFAKQQASKKRGSK